MQGMVYIDGELVPPERAKISVLDRGFLFGDSIFETMRVHAGVPFACAAHLARLQGSGERLGLAPPADPDELTQIMADTIQKSGLREAYLRLIVTRGPGPLGHDASQATTPTLVVMVLPLPHYPKSMYAAGQAAHVVVHAPGQLRKPDPQAKTGNYRHAVAASATARRHGAEEAIFVDAQGQVTEAGAANIFVLLAGTWLTPPLAAGILSGITRRTILQLCHHHGLAAAERPVMRADLGRAEEVFLCASVRQIVPIVHIDGQPVGQGSVGPATRALMQLYQAAVRQACAAS